MARPNGDDIFFFTVKATCFGLGGAAGLAGLKASLEWPRQGLPKIPFNQVLASNSTPVCHYRRAFLTFFVSFGCWDGLWGPLVRFVNLCKHANLS